MKSINVEGGFYFVEGEIFQIIREMRLEYIYEINKRGGGIFFVEGGIFQNR